MRLQGWGAMARVAVFVGIVLAARWLWHATAGGGPAGEIPVVAALGFEALLVGIVLGDTALVAWLERRPVMAFGLRDTRLVRHVMLGLGGGLGAIGAVLLALAAGGFLRLDAVLLSPAEALGYGAAWLAVFLLVGLGEEALFRGYLQTVLTERLGFWLASVATSLFFAAMHAGNRGETVSGLAAVVVGGLALCVLLRASGSLWAGIGFHAGWDWGQSFLAGTPDSGAMMKGHLLATHAAGATRFSGGSVGPEGSVLAAPIFLLGLVLLAAALRRGGYATGTSVSSRSSLRRMASAKSA